MVKFYKLVLHNSVTNIKMFDFIISFCKIVMKAGVKVIKSSTQGTHYVWHKT